MAFSLKSLFGRDPTVKTAHALYAETIRAARRTPLFTEMAVPDTPEGRFEILAVMAFLVLRRLKSEPAARELSQTYFDIMFDDIDSNLRELGVGDMSVGKKVKKLAQSFYGRIRDYENALEAARDGTGDGDDALQQVLRRNVYRGTSPFDNEVARLARQVRAEDAHLRDESTDALVSGRITFAAMQTEEGSR